MMDLIDVLVNGVLTRFREMERLLCCMNGKVPVSEADSCGVENLDYPTI